MSGRASSAFIGPHAFRCCLTPAHDQRGAARCGELTRARPVVPACSHRSAAPRLVHALVRWQVSASPPRQPPCPRNQRLKALKGLFGEGWCPAAVSAGTRVISYDHSHRPSWEITAAWRRGKSMGNNSASDSVSSEGVGRWGGRRWWRQVGREPSCKGVKCGGPHGARPRPQAFGAVKPKVSGAAVGCEGKGVRRAPKAARGTNKEDCGHAQGLCGDRLWKAEQQCNHQGSWHSDGSGSMSQVPPNARA